MSVTSSSPAGHSPSEHSSPREHSSLSDAELSELHGATCGGCDDAPSGPGSGVEQMIAGLRSGHGARIVTMAWVSIAAAALCGSAVVAGVLLTGLPGRVSEQRALLAGACCTALVGGVSAVVVSSASRTAEELHRRALRLMAFGLACWSAGSAVWLLILSDLLPFRLGRLGELGYLCSVVAIAAAVLQHPLLGPPAARLRTIMDSTIVGATGALMVWFVGARQLYAVTGDVEVTVFSMVYPTIEIGIVLTCLWMVSRTRRGSTDQAFALLLVIAYCAWALGDTLHLGLRTVRGERLPIVPDLPFVIGIGALAVAGWIAGGRARISIRPVDDRHLAERLGVAPAMAAVVAGIAVVTDGVARGRLDSAAVLLLTIVVGMVLARQSLTLRDNRDLAESLRTTVARLERQATHDGLTGLPNRSGLIARVDEGLRAARRRGRRAAVCFVDVDHLKAVNDSLGHHAGDELLSVLAQRLAEVGPEATRFGGDEFVVLATDLPDTAAATSLGERLLAEACRPLQLEGVPIRPSASIGIAVAEPGVDGTELLRRADVALYRAKAEGRRRAALYDAASDVDARRQIDLEPELRRALHADEFEVHYQPVVELITGRLTGVEALLRWRHPERGLLTPDAFLAEATSSGLLGSIGERTLQTVCRDFAPVVQRHAVTVAVNLSTTELTDHRVVERVRCATTTHGLPPEALVIEITEDVIVDETIRRTIDDLRSLGVTFAIDDFGTGNSSLRQLGTYPADKLKIDKSFIDRLEVEVDAVVITRAILGLARNLDLRTIAEGVETEAQAQLLTDLGCDRAQGWLYSRAVPFEQLQREFLDLAGPTLPADGDVGARVRRPVAAASRRPRP
jgi:diguanylate cyclase (GGDEF)-like protein